MTREILFCGKRVDTGKWVEGFYFNNGNKAFIFTFPYHVNYAGIKIIHEIDPATVCQYTGLTDKNGKKIFEGDLIRNQDGDIGRVTWCPEHAAFMIYCLNTNKVHFLYNNDFSKIEVFGNIHDNPELLEEAKP